MPSAFGYLLSMPIVRRQPRDGTFHKVRSLEGMRPYVAASLLLITYALALLASGGPALLATVHRRARNKDRISG